MKHENIYRKFYYEGCVFVVNQKGLLYSAEVSYCKEISLQFYLRF